MEIRLIKTRSTSRPCGPRDIRRIHAMAALEIPVRSVNFAGLNSGSPRVAQIDVPWSTRAFAGLGSGGDHASNTFDSTSLPLSRIHCCATIVSTTIGTIHRLTTTGQWSRDPVMAMSIEYRRTDWSAFLSRTTRQRANKSNNGQDKRHASVGP